MSPPRRAIIPLRPAPEWSAALVGHPVKGAQAWMERGRFALLVAGKNGGRTLFEFGPEVLSAKDAAQPPEAYLTDQRGRRAMPDLEAIWRRSGEQIRASFARIAWLLQALHQVGISTSYEPSREEALAVRLKDWLRQFDAASTNLDSIPGGDSGLGRDVGRYLQVATENWSQVFAVSPEDLATFPSWLRPVILGANGDVAALREHTERSETDVSSCLTNLTAAVFKRFGFSAAALRLYTQSVGALVPRESVDVCLEIADLHHQRGENSESIAWARRAILLQPDSARLARRAAARLIRYGALDDAFAVLSELAEGAQDVEAQLQTATLLAWSARAAEAKIWLERAATAKPDADGVWRLRGIIQVLEGHIEAARTAFERALAADPRDVESRLWLTEVLLRLGEIPAASRELKDARTSQDTAIHILLSAAIDQLEENELNQHLVSLSETLGSPLDVERWQKRGDRLWIRPWVLTLLDSFGGNRGELLTRLTASSSKNPELKLEVFEMPALDPILSSRGDSADIVKRIVTEPAQAVVEQFEALIRLYPDSPHPHCYRGEVYLWLGEWDRAIADFDAALACMPARWAYVGKAAVHILQGEYETALAQLDACHEIFDPIPGATTHVYLGEMYRRQGNLRDARTHLDEAVRIKTGRIGAWMNLALVEQATGNTARAHEIFEQLQTRVPRLFWDGQLSLGRAWPPRFDDMEPVFLECLRMMRGNRSSHTVTYFDAQNTFRVARDATSFAAFLQKHVHYIEKELDRRLLAQARR